jgi:hypothetical protein
MSVAACGSSSTGGSPTSSAGAASAHATGQSALVRWNRAYSYLSAQTKPTEIDCSWLVAAGGTPSPVPRPAKFSSFSDTAAWKSHLVTRNGPFPKGTFELCAATVPNTIPYGPAIEPFLHRFKLTFVADPNRPAGMTPIEIAYAGQNASDPDIIYRHKPGLFGLRIALSQLGQAPFVPGTSKIVQPTDDSTAARYLRFATPLLNWYGFKG